MASRRGTARKLDQSGTVLDSFSTPGSDVIGVGPNNCIYHGDDTDSSVYKLDRQGSIVSQTYHSGSITGIDADQDGCIWVGGEDYAEFIEKIALNPKIKFLNR